MYDEAFNKNDAEAVAALFTVDGVEMGPEGPASGQPDIVQRYLVLFQSHPTSHISKLGQVYAIGGRVCAITEWRPERARDTLPSAESFDGPDVQSQRESRPWFGEQSL